MICSVMQHKNKNYHDVVDIHSNTDRQETIFEQLRVYVQIRICCDDANVILCEEILLEFINELNLQYIIPVLTQEPFVRVCQSMF